MPDTWHTDLSHFIDEDGSVITSPPVAARLARYFGAIVKAVTSAPRPGLVATGVKCRRRPNRKPCAGLIDAVRDPELGLIIWACPECGDHGDLGGFQGTPWDTAPVVLGKILNGAFKADAGRAGPGTGPEPKFTREATRRWEQVDPSLRVRLLNNVFCGTCRGMASMQLLSARIEQGDLVLFGNCVRCGDPVARVIEGS